MGLTLHPADDRQGLAEVALSVARRVGQWHEHLPGMASALPYIVLDYGVLAIKPILVPETLKDALGRVALLPGGVMVLFQYPVNDAGEGLKLGTPRRSLPPVAWRHRVG